MQRVFYIFIVLLYFTSRSMADTYPEVIFENSNGAGSYAKSMVSYQGNSWVENVNNRLLVSDTLFFTPGNSLSLKYISSITGHWDAKVSYNKQKNHYRYNENDQLSFFLYIKSKDTKHNDLPRIYINLLEGSSDTVALSNYIGKFETQKWIQIKVPCKVFNSVSKESIVTGIGFAQNNASTLEHQLFIDQIEFLPSKFVELKLNSPAILTDAIPYDKMVHLKWQLPLSPSIRYVKYYRSSDGKEFVPIGIRPVHMQSCLDVVPKSGDKYYYKIVWLDYNYKESPASTVKEAITKPLSNDSIVDLIQSAHINYFVENFDINSGMYMPFRSKDKAIVSTKETAGAILSLIVGAEKKQVPRNVVLQRVSKVTFFLLKAQNKHGIYPSYFDGRKGIPEYIRGTTAYDVKATASLVEALLIAREYFNGEEEGEKDLRNRITTLYDQINWLAIADENMLLKSRFDILDTIGNSAHKVVVPLSGTNDAINTYLLAVSSRQYALPKSSYQDAVYYKYGIAQVNQVEEIDEFDTDVYADSVFIAGNRIDSVTVLSSVDTLFKKAIFEPISKYGVVLPFGEFSGSLMDLYKPFLTIKPNCISDTLVNWSDVLSSYVSYVKRRDNEFGVGTPTSDIWGFYQHRDSIGNYRINPAIGPSAIVSNPEIGKASILSLYKQYGDVLFGEYGFRSWLDLRNNDESDEYLAMNQTAIVIMLENVKSGLIWKLYEKIPELKVGRDNLFLKPVL